MSIQKKIGLFLLLFLLIAFSGFVAWGTNALPVGERANDALKGTKEVQVNSEAAYIDFIPQTIKKKGLIIYPGAKVAPGAYAPIALELAKEGFLTVIVPMPLNLAIFGSNKALKVMEKHPEIDNWSIVGHSLGGAMACKLCIEHPGIIEKLILLAAYTTKSYNLSESACSVLSISASHDGLTTSKKIEKNKEFLPPDTIFVEIEGGNHSQFGDYGRQMGDGEAQISSSEQIEKTVNQMLHFLEG